MPRAEWRFSYRPSPALPPLFWVAYVRPPLVEVHCGASVRRADEGFLEGTWAGGPELRDAAKAATVFATGIVLTADGPLVVTPSQAQEAVWTTRQRETTILSNSLAGLVSWAGLTLDPNHPYPSDLLAVVDLKFLPQSGTPAVVTPNRLALPTTSEPIEGLFYENFLIDPDGRLALARKRREAAFSSFDEYRRRITAATTELFAHGQPYTPIVALSAGYDSTAVAAVAAAAGCRRAVGFRTARQLHGRAPADDSGQSTAATLGLEMESFDRVSYLARDDLPEAEFLAGGMSGEDVVLAAMEPALNRTLLVTGHWGGRFWDEATGMSVRHLPQSDMSGCALTDFRLRLDFVHVPLPFFGALQDPELSSFPEDPDMQPYRIGGHYDRPIARRLAEEAGVARGTFAQRKIAASSLLHREGRDAFAPTTLAAIERFAAAEGRELDLGRPIRALAFQRGLIRAGRRLGLTRLVGRLVRRRRAAIHFEPRLGNLLFRWGVSVVGPRYRTDVASADSID